MALVFVGSADAFSSGQTSALRGPVLRWLFPGLSVFLVRKAAHLGEWRLGSGWW